MELECLEVECSKKETANLHTIKRRPIQKDIPFKTLNSEIVHPVTLKTIPCSVAHTAVPFSTK